MGRFFILYPTGSPIREPNPNTKRKPLLAKTPRPNCHPNRSAQLGDVIDGVFNSWTSTPIQKLTFHQPILLADLADSDENRAVVFVRARAFFWCQASAYESVILSVTISKTQSLRVSQNYTMIKYNIVRPFTKPPNDKGLTKPAREEFRTFSWEGQDERCKGRQERFRTEIIRLTRGTDLTEEREQIKAADYSICK